MTETPSPIETEQRERVVAADRDVMINRTEEEWDALFEAISTTYGWKAGHVLTEADIAALALVDKCHREDEETATDCYNRGREEGLRERGGDELVKLNERLDTAMIERATERALKVMAQNALSALQQENERLREALYWALGEALEDEFTARGHGEGALWWRKELRSRCALPVRAALQAPQSQGGEDHVG